VHSEVFRRYQPKGVLFREMVLFRPNDALSFVRDCQTSGTRLLGFDGFSWISEEAIQVRLEDSLDVSLDRYSQMSESEKCLLAERFLEERLGKNLLFEMVVDSPTGY
jgi:hypothetical protein